MVRLEHHVKDVSLPLATLDLVQVGKLSWKQTKADAAVGDVNRFGCVLPKVPDGDAGAPISGHHDRRGPLSFARRSAARDAVPLKRHRDDVVSVDVY
jgi:hypothetical protein